MDKRVEDALNGLASVVDAKLAELGAISRELRDATALDDAESTAIAERITAITGKLSGVSVDVTNAVNEVAVSESGGSGGFDGSGGGSGELGEQVETLTREAKEQAA